MYTTNSFIEVVYGTTSMPINVLFYRMDLCSDYLLLMYIDVLNQFDLCVNTLSLILIYHEIPVSAPKLLYQFIQLRASSHIPLRLHASSMCANIQAILCL